MVVFLHFLVCYRPAQVIAMTLAFRAFLVDAIYLVPLAHFAPGALITAAAALVMCHGVKILLDYSPALS
jgi:hypothetical protein